MIKKVYSFVDLEETSMINAINQSKNLSYYNTVIVYHEHWMMLKSKTSNTMTTQYSFLNVTEFVKSTQNLLSTLVASFAVLFILLQKRLREKPSPQWNKSMKNKNVLLQMYLMN